MNQTTPAQSILGDTPAPFSNQKQPGVLNDFDTAYTTWRTSRTPETNTALLKNLQPIIDTAVSSYAGANASSVLKNRARLLALQAMDKYDPQKGNVKTHLLTHLQRLRRLNAQSQNIIQVPEQVGLDFQKIQRIENDIRAELSRDPTDEEIADRTGLSVRRLRKIRQFNQPVAEGTAAASADLESGPNTDIASVRPDRAGAHDAWLNFVYDDLGPVDKIIMDSLLGRNGRRRTATQDLARRLNISPGAVSQRAAKIQAMIDKRYEHGF